MSGGTGDGAREEFFGALEAHLAEPLVSAQWFRPAGGFESAIPGLKRVLRRVFRSGDDHAANRLAAMNVLALTDSRLIAFSVVTGIAGLKVKKRIGEWPVDRTSVRFEELNVTSSKFAEGGNAPDTTVTSRWDIVRATLREHGDPRELRMDFPDNPLTHELIAAVKARRRSASDGSA